jgi:nucleoside-diphosphate-sugar epimerase
MRVLLTGASGFIGRYVLDALQCHGIDVVTASRVRPKGSVAFVEADLLNLTDFDALVQHVHATHLIHLAWYVEHGKYWSSPLNLRWAEATTRLVEAFCAAGGQRVVISGTCAEYDWSHGYCREDTTPVNSATLYGTVKDATRRLVMAVCDRHQVSYAWGRIFLPFGHGEPASRLVPSLIDVFRGQREPFGLNVLAYRDFLHVSDVAEGFIRLLKTMDSGTFNVSSGEPRRLIEVVTTLASLLGVDPDPVLALKVERLDDPPLLVGENIKLKMLGWRPELTLTEGLERTLYGERP